MNNLDLAKKIIELVGGRENVISVYHCVTRLRFQLKDWEKAKLSDLEKTEGILDAKFQSGEIQIIIGVGVEKVFVSVNELLNISGAQDMQKVQPKKQKKKISDSIHGVLGAIPEIFMPIVPAIAGTGLLKGLLAIISIFNLASNTSETVQILSLISDCVFYFFPFMLAYTCAEKFKTNKILALALAGAYMYPTIINGAVKGGTVHLFGLLPIPLISYSSTVFPIILSVLLLSYLYRFVDQIMPNALKIVFTPLITLMIMVPLELAILGPIGNYVGEGLALGAKWLFTVSPLLAGGIIAAFIPVLVLFGMHQALGAIIIQSISSLGYDYMLPMFLISELAQTGAVLGVYLKTKDKKMKPIAQAATFSGLIGITEPALYGCLIKYRRAFVAAMIGGGIGGAFAAAFGAKAYAYSMPCLLTLPVFAGPALPFVLIGASVAFITPVLVLCFRGLKEPEDTTREDVQIDQKSALIVYSPIEGEIVPIDQVADTTFSEGILGQGIAVKPTDGTIIAPFDGTVINTFDTKHALTLRSKSGIELLIHMGINTVQLKGRGFTTRVKSGDAIKRGEVIATMDLNEITKAGYSTITPILITNTSSYSEIATIKKEGNISNNEPLLAASK